MFKQLFHDTTYTGLSQLVLSINQIIIQVLVVKFTTQKEFGEFTTANTIENLIEISFISRSGEMALKYVGKYWVIGDYISAKICADKIKRFDWIINIFIYICIVMFSGILSHFLKFNYLYLILLGLQIPSQIGYGVSKSLFISAYKIREQALFEITLSCTQLISCFLGVYFLGINGLILAFVFSSFYKTFLARIITERWWLIENCSSEVMTVKKELIKTESWLNVSIHSMLRNIFMNGANQADILIISAFNDSESTAIYKIAKSLSSLPVRFISPIWSALRPRFINAYHNNNYNKLFKLVAVPSIFMIAILFVVIFISYFFTKPLILLLYGNRYLAATLPFIILMTGNWIFGGVTGWFNFWIIISNYSLLGTLVYGFLLVMILCMCTLYHISSIQVAYNVSFSMIITSIICWVIFFKMLKTSTQLNKN